MYQFFVEAHQIMDGTIRIEGADHNHIRNVLRMKQGERIRISDPAGKSYFCYIREITPEEVFASIEEEDQEGTELSNRITLFQGLPKGDKMELIIQKAVELGAYEVVPVVMQNCVVKLDAKKVESKVRRWQAIAESAAKQSKRTIIPQIQMPVSWKRALEQAGELDQVLLPYENQRGMEETRRIVRAIRPSDRVGVIIGPEGGFSESEIRSLPPEIHRISLGRRILRTETAGFAALAMLIYELDR